MSRNNEEAVGSILVGIIMFLVLGLAISAIAGTISWQNDTKKNIATAHAKILSSTAPVESLTISNAALRSLSLPPSVKVQPSEQEGCSDLVGPPKDIAKVFIDVIELMGW